LFCGSFLFLLVFINAYDILNLLPEKYSEGVWVLKVISIGGLINTATGLNISFIAYSKKYHFATFALIFLAFLSAISNILLIPRFGLMGAAIGTAFSLIIVNFSSVLFIKKQFEFQPFDKIDVLILLITIFLVFIDLLLPKIPNSIFSILIKSSLVFFIYGIIVVKMRLIEKLRI
jgi:O-antigen/teichoic acid export membrane protein